MNLNISANNGSEKLWEKKHCDFLYSYCSFTVTVPLQLLFLYSYCSFREWQTLKNIGNSSKTCFACYTIVKEIHGTTVLVLHFLCKILDITAAEAFAVLKLPFREEKNEQNSSSWHLEFRSGVIPTMGVECLDNVWTLYVCTDTRLGLFQSFCPGDVYFPKCCRPLHPPIEMQVSAYQHDNRCNGWHWIFTSGRWCCIPGFVVPNSF